MSECKICLGFERKYKSVLFRAKISGNFKEEIIQFGKKNSIYIYQVVLSPSTYEINAEKII